MRKIPTQLNCTVHVTNSQLPCTTNFLNRRYIDTTTLYTKLNKHYMDTTTLFTKLHNTLLFYCGATENVQDVYRNCPGPRYTRFRARAEHARKRLADTWLGLASSNTKLAFVAKQGRRSPHYVEIQWKKRFGVSLVMPLTTEV